MAGEGVAYTQEKIMELLEQRKSVMARGGAGCGKTYSLVKTIQELLSLNTKIDISCITYTNAAADEVQSRVNAERVVASTIHSFLWGFISPFERQLEECYLALIEDESCKSIKLSGEFKKEDVVISNGITYEDYPDTLHGVVSHDGVIALASLMFKRFEKLGKLVADCYPYIFVDEYQDTNPKVIDILFNYIKPHGATIALFGDAMQSIYDGSVGDAQGLVDSREVDLLVISQNRRNPLAVIELANRLRSDGIKQRPSEDSSAPNMEEGEPRQGSARFAFVTNGFNPKALFSSEYCQGWTNENTKILCLTHRKISGEAGFERIASFYGKDEVVEYIRKEMRTHPEISEETTLGEFIARHSTSLCEGNALRLADENAPYAKHWKLAMSMSLSDILGRYHFRTEKLYSNIDASGFGLDWDYFTIALRKAFDLSAAFDCKNYGIILNACGHLIDKAGSKGKTLKALKKLSAMCCESSAASAGEVLDTIAEENLLPKVTANVRAFKKDNPYAYAVLSSIPFEEFGRFYQYVDKTSPYATQHGVKGLEYENVLLLLDSGGWSKYDFRYVIDSNIKQTLSAGKLKSFVSKECRSRKLLYVGCTRARNNLLVCAEKEMDTKSFRAGVERLFGKENVLEL